ncbi:hypothetical protein F1880_006230 [Penicillium rolfsii]|nr:hypothetical protein F1880_006230 [Penicillium rolfsii]
MASIHDMNQPPNPFWDYLAASFENHPFFAPRGHHQPPPPFGPWGNHHHRHQHHGPPPPPFWGWGPQDQGEDHPRGSDTPRDQTTEPTAGPSNSNEKSRDAEKEATSSPEIETDNEKRPHGRCGKGKHHGRGGPHGLGRGRGGRGRCGPGHYEHPGSCGPRERGGHYWGGRGGRGRHHGGLHHLFGAGPGSQNFDGLRNLASQFGIQLNGPAPEGVDFVPSVDIFDTPANYIVHVSLPGAKKDDLSIDYDPDESVLRLAGVVYRPGISEELHQSLAVEERTREVGVFEREVRLGTHEAPAAISIHDISAKLEDGVLNVTLPKIVPEPELKKKIVVEDGNVVNEKDAMQLDEKASVTLTPSESDESDSDEGETKEYVKVPVN